MLRIFRVDASNAFISIYIFVRQGPFPEVRSHMYSPLSSRFTGIYILDIVPGIVAASAVSGDWTDNVIVKFYRDLYFGYQSPVSTPSLSKSCNSTTRIVLKRSRRC